MLPAQTHAGGLLEYESRIQSFYSHALCKVSRLIDIPAQRYGSPVCEDLEHH